MANSTCAGWGARARSTTFARIAGGTTCTTSLRAAKVTHTAPTDGATTFDSPFPAVLLAVWGNLPILPAFGQSGGFFVHKFLCTGWDAVGLRPMRRVSAKSPPSGGDLSARGACPSPYAHAGGLGTPSAPEPDHQTTGATRAAGRGRRTRRGKRSAHGQRPGGRPQRQRGCKGARPARNRPRRRRGARERAPRPPLKFPLGGEPRRGKPDGGKGGAPLDGRGGGRGASPREMNSPALPHATAGAAAIGQASGRRHAAAAPEGRKGHAPARHEDARESAASGQADQTDDGEAASGRGSNCPPPRAPETARPRQRTAARRRGGRRRRRPGGTRARLSAAPLCHQRRAHH